MVEPGGKFRQYCFRGWVALASREGLTVEIIKVAAANISASLGRHHSECLVTYIKTFNLHLSLRI